MRNSATKGGNKQEYVKPEVEKGSATEFLLSLRKAYLKGKILTPRFVTFYVSPRVYKDYIIELEKDMRIAPADLGEKPNWYHVCYIRVKEDKSIRGLDSRVEEGREHWSS